MDISYKTDGYIFSYRVAGVYIKDGRVLLQKPANDDGYAFPGGQVAFGETNEETLVREFKEETGADVTVGELRWVGELLFPWGSRLCHQICLYYDVIIDGVTVDDMTAGNKSGLPSGDKFTSVERHEGRNHEIEFYRVPLENIGDITLYPTNVKDFLLHPLPGVRHFVYKE